MEGHEGRDSVVLVWLVLDMGGLGGTRDYYRVVWVVLAVF